MLGREMNRIMDISPSSTINFSNYGPEIVGQLQLTNISEDKIIFDIHSNFPEKYDFKPPSDILISKEDILLSIELKTGTVCEENDKVIIRCIQVQCDIAIDDIQQYLELHPEAVNIYYLSCAYPDHSEVPDTNLYEHYNGSIFYENFDLISSESEENLPIDILLEDLLASQQELLNNAFFIERMNNEEFAVPPTSRPSFYDSLDVTPRAELKFSPTKTTCTMNIENGSGYQVAYELMTNNHDGYFVGAPTGFIGSDETFIIEINLLGSKCDEDDEFVLILTKIEEGMSIDDIVHRLNVFSPDWAAFFKFWCVWEQESFQKCNPLCNHDYDEDLERKKETDRSKDERSRNRLKKEIITFKAVLFTSICFLILMIGTLFKKHVDIFSSKRFTKEKKVGGWFAWLL